MPGSATLLTVERGLDVLRAFRSDRAPLSNAELVRRTGLPKSTISRLTSTLIHVGFIRLVPGRREFELASGALGIGQAYLSFNELLQSAQPLMQELADQLNTSVALGAQDGVDMLYVACRASRKVATLRLGVGSVLPMAATSIGRAYLWGLPTNERSVLLDEHLRKAGAKGKELAHAIQASFVELDATGTCAVMGGYQRDAFGVALPLRVGKSKILMALSCGKADVGADLRSEHARITPVLIEAARSLELLLGTINGHL